MLRNEYQANVELANAATIGVKKDVPVGYITGPVIRDVRYAVEKVGDPNDSATWELV